MERVSPALFTVDQLFGTSGMRGAGAPEAGGEVALTLTPPMAESRLGRRAESQTRRELRRLGGVAGREGVLAGYESIRRRVEALYEARKAALLRDRDAVLAEVALEGGGQDE